MDVQHPGGALAYGFAESRSPSTALAHMPDNELVLAEAKRRLSSWRESFSQFVRGGSFLVQNTTYSTEEYEHERGWGHSTYRDGVELALEAGARTLVLFHHEPRPSDEELDRSAEECRLIVDERGGALEVAIAAEGLAQST